MYLDEEINPFDEMSTEEFFAMIRESMSEEERQRNHDELHREHVMIINPKMKKRLIDVLSTFKKMFGNDYYEISYQPMVAMPQHLQLSILCHDFGIGSDEINDFSKMFEITDGITISDSGYEDKVSVSMIINDFFMEIK